MRTLVIFSALIVCGLATWAPSHGHQQQQQHPHGPHQAIARHEAAIGRAAEVNRGHHIGDTRGQMESVHHGGGTVFPDKEFHRIKKGQQKRRTETSFGRNHLRRHSRKHYGQ